MDRKIALEVDILSGVVSESIRLWTLNCLSEKDLTPQDRSVLII